MVHLNRGLQLKQLTSRIIYFKLTIWNFLNPKYYKAHEKLHLEKSISTEYNSNLVVTAFEHLGNQYYIKEIFQFHVLFIVDVFPSKNKHYRNKESCQ